MAADTNTPTEAVLDAAVVTTEAAAETVREAGKQIDRAVKSTAKAAKTTAKAAAKTRKAPRKAAAKTRKAPRKAAAKARKTARSQPRAKTNKTTAKAARTERKIEMNFDPKTAFAGFGAFPANPGFEKMANEAASRSEELATRSRKAAEELADMARGNVDAFVEAGRIATDGAQSIGQSVMAKSRDNVELAANTVRAMTEAKNPADLLQLQADFVRSAFDRFVEESSTLTESMVKVAGESFQPLSTRASENVERVNDIIA